MDTKLSREQIEYVLFHLDHHYEGFLQFRDVMFYGDKEEGVDNTGAELFFLSSSKSLSYNDVVVVEQVPVLFPIGSELLVWEEIEGGGIVFKHDYLKSAFYLLSGYQEYCCEATDVHGRFPYAESAQFHLGAELKPWVNYYFEFILRGMAHYCNRHGIPFKRKQVFPNFALFLSHDVDRINFHHPRQMAYRLLQLLGVRPKLYSLSKTIQLLFKDLLALFTKADPWWTFDYLLKVEQQLGIKGTYLFLEKEEGDFVSRYRFSHEKIKQLIDQLLLSGAEVGLHGGYYKYLDGASLLASKQRLEAVSRQAVVGNRQHYLRVKYPDSFLAFSEAGIGYDSSMGFSETPGFRNGYCHPFKPFDHATSSIVNVWEIPLAFMEASFMELKEFKFSQMEGVMSSLVSEVKKFGGVLGVLWHNCRLDEHQFPEIKNQYLQLLQSIVDQGGVGLTGKELINTLSSPNDNSQKGGGVIDS